MTAGQQVDERRRPVCMSVTVITDDPALMMRAQEAFGRAALGLALEGLYVQQHMSYCEDDDEGGTEDGDTAGAPA